MKSIKYWVSVLLLALATFLVWSYGQRQYGQGGAQTRATMTAEANKAQLKALQQVRELEAAWAAEYAAKQKELEREKQTLQSSLTDMRTAVTSLRQQLNASAASTAGVSCAADPTCERYRASSETYRLLFEESVGRYAEMAEEASGDLAVLWAID